MACIICNGYFGCPVCTDYEPTYEVCPDCNGECGWDEDGEFIPCETCNGDGEVIQDEKDDYNSF